VSANSVLRRAVKAALHPLLGERTYSYVQGVAKAIDIRRGKWSEPEMDLIAYAVQPGDDVLDLGANFGMYTYPLSKAVGASGRVYAFEPVPFTNRALTVVTRLLGLKNVTVVSKGCSDVAATIDFELPIQPSGAPSAGQAYIGRRNDDRSGRESQVRWNQTRRVSCEVVALDSYLPELRRLSLIKCDIEGAELLAFRGAVRTIEKHRPSIICEINPWFLDGFGLRLEDLVGFFIDRGYGLYRYGADRMLAPVRDLSAITEDNYVFLHPTRLPPFAPLIAA